MIFDKFATIASVFLIFSSVYSADGEITEASKSIQVSPSRVEFGIVEHQRADQVVTTNVEVKNKGNTPVKISKIIASCGCTKPQYSKLDLAPNESMIMQIGMRLTGIYGDKETSVALIFTDGSYIAFPVHVHVKSVMFYSPEIVHVENRVGVLRSDIEFQLSKYIDAKEQVLFEDEPKFTTPLAVSFRATRETLSQAFKANSSDEAGVFGVAIDTSKLNVGSYNSSVVCTFSNGSSIEVPLLIDIQPELYLENSIILGDHEKNLQQLDFGKYSILPQAVEVLLDNSKVNSDIKNISRNRVVTFSVPVTPKAKLPTWHQVNGSLQLHFAQKPSSSLNFVYVSYY